VNELAEEVSGGVPSKERGLCLLWRLRKRGGKKRGRGDKELVLLCKKEAHSSSEKGGPTFVKKDEGGGVFRGRKRK